MSECQLWVQIDPDDNLEGSISSVKLFMLYRRLMHSESHQFRHYFTVVGYGGGGVQEECTYRIDGSNPNKRTVYYSPVSGPSNWEMNFTEGNLNEEPVEFDKEDIDVQKEFQMMIENHLSYDQDSDCFAWNSSLLKLPDTGIYSSSSFPIQKLKGLSAVYWPFSLSFD
jgi:hypothetical protein